MSDDVWWLREPYQTQLRQAFQEAFENGKSAWFPYPGPLLLEAPAESKASAEIDWLALNAEIARGD